MIPGPELDDDALAAGGPDRLAAAFAPTTTLPGRLIDALDVGVVVQFGGEIVSANPAAARTLGLTLDELLGRSSIDPRWRTVHLDGSPFAGEGHPAMVALRTGGPATAVMGVHTPDGELRWIDVVARPLVTTGGRVVATFTHFIDITEQRRADDERTGVLVRYEALLAESSEAILVVDPDSTIRYAGPSSAHTLGRVAGALEGTSVLAIADPKDRSELAHVLEQCTPLPNARAATTISVAMAGDTRRWFEVRVRNAMDLPEIGALVVTLTDVHDRVTAVERLRAVNEQLEDRLAERDEEHRVDRELAAATELLGHCTDDAEVCDVVWTAAARVFEGVPVTLLRARVGTTVLGWAEGSGAPGRDVDADDCWAMRTHRVHLSGPDDGLACAHLPRGAPPTICVPLGLTTRPYGLLVVEADDGVHTKHARAFADRLGPLLARAAAPLA